MLVYLLVDLKHVLFMMRNILKFLIYFFLCDHVAGSKTPKPNTLELIDEIFEKLATFNGQSLNSALNVLIFCIYLSICHTFI